jgi:putative membrane protein insertion efficiency factor
LLQRLSLHTTMLKCLILPMRMIKKWLGFPLIVLVRIYQLFISPLFPASCRYTPTCSSYMIEAIQVWGPIKGTFLGLKRISKCHPRGGFGYDPVPKPDSADSNAASVTDNSANKCQNHEH